MSQFLLAALAGLLAFISSKVEVRGMENVPRSGAFIVAANHIAWIDPPLLRWVIGRRIRYMTKIELFRWNISGLAIRLFDAFPVRRDGRDRVALRQALRLLENGEILGMFPEGTRSKDLKLARGHPGVALVALRSGAPILPVGIIETNRILKWPDMVFRNPRVIFNIGEPFALSREDGSYQEGMRLVMLKIADLLPREMRGYYADVYEQSGDGVPDRVNVLGEGVKES